MKDHQRATSSRPRVCIVHPLLRAREYQERPQFAELCSWWKAGGFGVCALVGIGGAGKTAIVERFIRALPGVLPTDPALPNESSLETPAGVFVFSFYDAPNPDKFFSELAVWLTGKAGESPLTRDGLSFSQLLPLLENVAPALLILDGLEKVQDEGGRGGIFGQIEDARLRDFLLRVADGLLMGLSVIVTTRFPIFEPLAQRSRFYHVVSVETLEPGAAVALLRARGVVFGSDDDLLRLAKEQGFHALTLDLMGGYIARFHGGDVSRLPSEQVAEDVLRQEDDPSDPDLWALRQQERRFARLAKRYSEALAERDPAMLALLQRVCLFRMGVDAKALTAIFLRRNFFDRGKLKLSGKLAALSEVDLRARLKALVQMRLLESSVRKAEGVEVYTAHPAVRDSFVRSLDPDYVRSGHEAASRNLEAMLGSRPGEKYPSEPDILDALEEIIYHTLEAGRREDAWDIYWERIGGYRNLGWRLAAYDRGERICRAFGKIHRHGSGSGRLPTSKHMVMMNDWALFLADLGSLEAASKCYEEYIAVSLSYQDWINASVGQQNLSLSRLSTGRLRQALRDSEDSILHAERGSTNLHLLTNSCAQSAYVKALLGDVQGSLEGFRTAFQWQRKLERRDVPLYSNRGLWYALVLLRLEKLKSAETVISSSDQVCSEATGAKHHQDFASHYLGLADLARLRGDIPRALGLLGQAHEWALARNAQELICWATIIRGKIELAQAGSPPEKLDPDRVRAVRRSLDEGMHIARSCGFGILYIDLLVLQARAQLLTGDDQAAERSALTALFGLSKPRPGIGAYDAQPLDENSSYEHRGIFPIASSGLPGLLAATHPECAYRWGEADARQVLAEALLARASRLIGRTELSLAAIERLPSSTKNLIARAHKELNLCWKLRIRMGDPNAQAVEMSLEKLASGRLVDSLLAVSTPQESAMNEDLADLSGETQKFDVFLSHNAKNMPAVYRLAEALKSRGIKVWFDKWELVPGRPWQEAIEAAIQEARSVAILVGQDGLGPWEIPEMRAALSEGVRRGVPVIPVLLPGAAAIEPTLPVFLRRYTWVDLRIGVTEDGLDSLEWGITGVKPR